ncbi:MAG: hypothetical protein JWN15_3830 [Firmicutes bacterium]|nr:hypothetical protein [Bacillota bacterium]
MLSISSELSTIAGRLQAYAADPAANPVWAGLHAAVGAQALYDLYPLCAQAGQVLWLRCAAPGWSGAPLHAQCLEAVGVAAEATPAEELPWSAYLAAQQPPGAAMDAVLRMIGQLQAHLMGADGEGKPGFLLLADVQWLTATDRRFLHMLVSAPWMRRVAIIAAGTALPAEGLLPFDLSLTLAPDPVARVLDLGGEVAEALLVAVTLYGDGMPAAFASGLFPDAQPRAIGLAERAARLYLQGADWRQAAVRLARSKPERARRLAGRLAELEARSGWQPNTYRLAGLCALAQDSEGLSVALHRLYLATPPFDGQATEPLWRRLRRLAKRAGKAETWALATSNLALTIQSRERSAEASELIAAAAAKLAQPEARWRIRYEAAQMLTRSRDTSLFPTALAHYEAALTDLDSISPPPVQASGRSAVMNGLALVSVYSDRPDEALGRELRAIQYLERLPAKSRRSTEIQDQLMTNCLRMGDVYRKRLKDYPPARYWYRRALRHAHNSEQKWSAFFAHKSLGLVGADAGAYAQALRDFHLAIQALEASRSRGTSRSSLHVELNQVRWFAADMLYNLTRYADALQAFQALLQSGVPLTPRATQLLETRIQLCQQQLGAHAARQVGAPNGTN